MNILFFTVSNKRSRDIESQALEFNKSGHRIYLLTLSTSSELHNKFEDYGFYAEASANQYNFLPLYIFKNALFLGRFCRRHQIDLVYSHLDPCNIVAVFTQFFIKSKFIICRHHADALKYESNKKGRFISRMVYKIARKIIVVSQNSKKFMVASENINPSKIQVIPLSFNFDLYEIPKEDKIQNIRNQYQTSLLLVTVGRFTSLKRIDKIIELVKLLHLEGYDAKLLILGGGLDERNLRDQVRRDALESIVFFVGYVSDVLPYIKASDVYIHFSITEASCTTVKEAALVSRPVIVCKGVGDFDEYIENGASGWLVDKDFCVNESAEILKSFSKTKDQFQKVGDNLNKKVLRYFDIKNVVSDYEKLHRL